MTYMLEIVPKCGKAIGKLCKKDPILKDALKKKISEILENPYHYKPLRYDLYGERRVHIIDSFVLIFEINEIEKKISLKRLKHHDNAYE